MPDDHPCHYTAVSLRERRIAQILAAAVILIVTLCCGSVVRWIVTTG